MLCLREWEGQRNVRACVCCVFSLVSTNQADRKLSNVDYFRVESSDFSKSRLCSEQANARVLWGQLLPLLMLLLYSPFYSFSIPSPPSFSLPLQKLPLSLFLTYIMTWTMSWQHKEPSDFVPVPALAPLSHEASWFNKSGFRHRWLIARPNVFYEQSAGSYIGLICVIMPSKNANVNFNNWHVILSYFSLLL